MWSPPARRDSWWTRLRALPRLAPQVWTLLRVTDRADRQRASAGDWTTYAADYAKRDPHPVPGLGYSETSDN